MMDKFVLLDELFIVDLELLAFNEEGLNIGLQLG